jgi:hypothetical protein
MLAAAVSQETAMKTLLKLAAIAVGAALTPE